MDKKPTMFVLLFLTLTLFFRLPTLEVRAFEAVKNQAIDEIVAKKLDMRAQILEKYLAKFDSPMQYNAQDFIDAAKAYNLDWKMLPAIAGVESTFGRHIPGGFNAYGWGVYGSQAIYFTSWTDGIFTVAKGLRENYLDKGLNDPYSINKVYAESPAWGRKVSYFMNDLEKFAENHLQENKELVEIAPDAKIAAISASPVLR
jgi:hypothetical protein